MTLRTAPGPYDVAPLRKDGERVWVATVEPEDVRPYADAVRASAERIRPWNPVDPKDIDFHLRRQSAVHRTFLIHAYEPLAGYDIVGKVNVSNIVRGRAQAATLGYDSYDPYAGKGLFKEGLRLILDIAFTPEHLGGLGLHRVEAHVQPGNVASAMVLRSLGFTRRSFWPSYLHLPDIGTPQERADRAGEAEPGWRDHLGFGILARDWPARPYRQDVTPPQTGPRPIVVLGSYDEELAGRVATELGVSLIGSELVGLVLGGSESGAALLGLIASGPGAVVVLPEEGRAARRQVLELLDGLDRPVIRYEQQTLAAARIRGDGGVAALAALALAGRSA